MKKSLFFISTAFVLFAACVSYAAGNATVYTFEGDVSIIRNKKTTPVEQDMPLLDGDILRTESDGMMDLSLNNLAGVRYKSNSEGVLVTGNESEMHLTLKKGAALLNVKKLPSGGDMEFETPMAVAVVADAAQFSCDILPAENNTNKTVITVRRGTIRVRTAESGVTIAVLTGQSVDVVEKAFVPAARNATDEEIKTADEAKNVYIAQG
jgi:hypothetical protein